MDQTPSFGIQQRTVRWDQLPQTLPELMALPEAAMATPFDTAALTVAALCRYPQDPEECFRMLDHLRGPRPLTEADKQFLADRFRGKDYVPRSYFAGAVPENDYQPAQPYTLTIQTDAHSEDEPGIVKVYLPSGGADDLRPVKLRLTKDGRWLLWQQYLLTGIRLPASADPWA